MTLCKRNLENNNDLSITLSCVSVFVR